MNRWKSLWLGVIVISVSAILVPNAFGYAYYSGNYANGTLGPNDSFSSTYDDSIYSNWCLAIDESEAVKPSGYNATVAIIDSSGGWPASYRGTGGDIAAIISPDTVDNARSYIKKAYVINSGASTYTLHAYRGYWKSDNVNCYIV